MLCNSHKHIHITAAGGRVGGKRTDGVAPEAEYFFSTGTSKGRTNFLHLSAAELLCNSSLFKVHFSVLDFCRVVIEVTFAAFCQLRQKIKMFLLKWSKHSYSAMYMTRNKALADTV